MQVPGRGDNGYVFRYSGSAISDIRTGIIEGCKGAGNQYGREGGFVFHDLRHTAKTIARKAGVDKNVRMVMFGHSGNNDMDFWYDSVDEGDLIDAINRVGMFLQNSHYRKEKSSQY